MDSLCKKYRKAIGDLAIAQEEHDALNKTIDEEQIVEWTAAESNAMKKQLTDVTVMDIYDVKKAKGMFFIDDAELWLC